MCASGVFTLGKEERICSKKLIDMLFKGGNSHSVVAFPLRAVYMMMERTVGEPQAQMLVSVPKRHLKHAVKRNRVKRQVREAYRKNKNTVLDGMSERPEAKMAIAFIWLGKNLRDTACVERCMKDILRRICEKL